MSEQLIGDLCFVFAGFIAGGWFGMFLSWREVRKSGYVRTSFFPWKMFAVKKVEVEK